MGIDQKPFFSVVIATYNAATTICKSIESVLSQNERAQILIMDGLSSDDTVVLARRYELQGVNVHVEKDNGVYDAWNKGLDHAQGEWIIFLGADDYYNDPNALGALRKSLDSVHKQFKIAYGKVEMVNDSGAVISIDNKPWGECSGTLRKNMPYTHTGSAHHRSIFFDKRFDPEFKIAGDYNFLYSFLLKEAPLFVPEYVVQMGGGDCPLT